AWSSSAQFITDLHGALDLAQAAPVAGSYKSADPHGLLWSMILDPAICERTPFVKMNADPVKVELTVESNGKTVADPQLIRRFLAPGVFKSEVTDDALVAAMYRHEDGPRPGIILIGGSGGGLSADHPALLASRGYAVMSLAYFAMPGLPPNLIEIPLEYFWKA